MARNHRLEGIRPRYVLALLAVVLAAAMCPSPAFAAYAGFTDLSESHWAVKSGVVDWASETGTIHGYPDGRWAPDDTVSRGTAAQMLCNYAGGDGSNLSEPYTDVSDSDWYRDAVAWCKGTGIMNGYSGTSLFGASDALTREQAVSILCRAYSNVVTSTAPSSILNGYADGGDVSSWAADSMRWAVANGVVSGYTNSGGKRVLDPTRAVTRAELAAMLKNCDGKWGAPELTVKAGSEKTAAVGDAFGFFSWLGNQACVDILNDAAGYTDTKGALFSASTTKGDAKDATSLDNMYEALKVVEKTNQLRAANGLSELRIQPELMAIAELHCNWSDYTVGVHPKTVGEHYADHYGENIAWNGYGVDHAFRQWYDDELALKNSGVTDYERIGHYENIVNSEVGMTGAAVSQNGYYKGTYTQEFAHSGWFSGAGYTVSEFRALLDAYKATL